MSEQRITELEEALAHVTRVVEDLSEVIARQDRQIDRMAQRMEMLMSREAERELETGASVPLADQKPPHW